MPSEVRFADIRRSLEQHGWTLDRIRGSHHIFVKEGEGEHICLPVHQGKVRPGYVRKAEKLVGAKLS